MRELRLVLLGLAALIALSLGATFLMRAFRPPAPVVERHISSFDPAVPPPAASEVPETPDVKAARADIERAIADSPDYTRYFDRLRLVFPSDYDAILNQLAAAVPGHDINIDKVMLEAMAALRRTHGALIAKAPDDALLQYFTLKTKEVQELGQRDPHLCVVFFGGAASSFLGFDADHRELVADTAIAGLDAMNSGRDADVQRAVPSPADLKALDRALVDAGLSRPEISVLLDDEPANPPIPDARMCQAQQTYLTTMAGMAPDSRARLLAFWADLIAKS